MKKFFNNLFSKKEKEPDLENNGLIGIKNGKFIKGNLSTTKDEELPTMNVIQSENLKVLVNGVEVVGDIKIFKDDEVEFQINDPIVTEQDVRYELRHSDDLMKVYMKKIIKRGTKRALQDYKFSKSIDTLVSVVEYTPTPCDPFDLKFDIQSEGYKGIYLEENITKLAESTIDLELEVLCGTKPIDGVAPYFTRVHEEKSINIISKDDIIAEYVPAVMPIEGRNVFGDPIELDFSYTLPLIGKNVVGKDGKLIAERDGRLTFDEKVIEITPQLVITGDLSAKDGPIIFNEGDIVIEGKVLEKSIIKATGAVFAKEGIFGSTIYAGDSLNVKGNISGSNVYVGANKFILIKAMRFLTELKPKVDNLQFSSISKYINSVFTKEMFKLHDLFEDILEEDLNNFFKNIKLAVQLTEYSFKNVNRKALTDQDKENLMACQEALRALLIEAEGLDHYPDSKAIMENITNSELYCSGAVEITGEGTYLSFIESGEKVVVKNKVNGGTIIAEKQIEVGEFKSYNSVDFGLIVYDKKGNIRIKKRYPDTTIKVHETKNVSLDLEYNVNFREPNNASLK